MINSKFYHKKKSKIGLYINNILICIIILLSSLIICNYSSNVRSFYQNKVLKKNISFNDFKKLYNKIKSDGKEELLVSNNTPLNLVEKSGDSYIVNYESEPVYYLKPGIIVYIGEKDDLGNTVIVQGNDGVDIWYSNVTDLSNSLYDYVKSSDILGNAKDGKLVLTLDKNGTYLDYEEYMEN